MFVAIWAGEMLDTQEKAEFLAWDETVEAGDDPTPVLQTVIRKRDAAWEKVVSLTPQLPKIKHTKREAGKRFLDSFGFVEQESGRWRQKERVQKQHEY